MSSGGGSGHLRFELTGDPDELASRVEDIESFLSEAGCVAAVAMQMAMIAEELLTNILREAWPGNEPGFCAVDVKTAVVPGGIEVMVRTEDDGTPFDPLTVETPDLEASIEERSVGGLGIHLIRSLTDKQAYRRLGDRNVFEAVKLCPAP